MFERFSGGYYLGRLYVESHEGDRPVMQLDQHERVNAQLYTSAENTGDTENVENVEGLKRLDTPLVMKLGTRHFPVHGDETVPTDTLALPSSDLEACGLDNPPELRGVLLATAERAFQLLRLSGHRIAGDDPTH
jgi:hypothetical protein